MKKVYILEIWKNGNIVKTHVSTSLRYLRKVVKEKYLRGWSNGEFTFSLFEEDVNIDSNVLLLNV